jgi:hypothetical protein
MTTRCSLGILFMVLLAGSGCRTVQKPQSLMGVTYESEPAGATVYELDGAKAGRTGGKYTLHGNWPWSRHTISEEDRLNGYKDIKPVIVRWASGACVTTETARVALTGVFDRANKTVTVMRPSDAPNVELDVMYSAQLEQNEAIRDQSRAQERAADAAQRAADAAEKTNKRLWFIQVNQ